jgi:DNA recombination protein RmuC
MLTNLLLGLIVILLAVLIYLLLRKPRASVTEMEYALSSAWAKLGIDEKVGRLELYANDIRQDYRSFEKLLRAPAARGALGEIGLEVILTDQLPPQMYGIRRRILNGKIPDAYVESTVGIICIDSKFPLDNYRRMVEGEAAERDSHKKRFLRDVYTHLHKIAIDYVCPDQGSADFAFAYIPSEGIYWFLANEATDLLRNFTKQGVQVVSPLTLAHKVELIKAGVYAKHLTDEAENIRAEIIRLSRGFKKIEEEWQIFYQSHFDNLYKKARDVDLAYKKLRDEFDQIARLSDE